MKNLQMDKFYEDYLRYKNMRLMVQDVEGINESLNGNTRTIGM